MQPTHPPTQVPQQVPSSPAEEPVLQNSAIKAPSSGWRSWLHSLRVYREPASLRMLALGFSSGLPFPLVLATLSFWLSAAGIDRTTIGYLSWVGLVYAFKWVWAPLVDRLPIPFLTSVMGRRRSWLLIAQIAVIFGLVGMAFSDPHRSLNIMVWFALGVAFGSATQDIALDAFRIESADIDAQAALAASYQTGYRLAMTWAGAGVFLIAAWAQQDTSGYQSSAWKIAYCVMALSMVVGILTVLYSPEPTHKPLSAAANLSDWLKDTVISPFADFFKRYGSQALLVISLIAVYRISDIVMGIMAFPFYYNMGFTLVEVATVTKIYGVVMTLAGAFAGGVLCLRWGVMRVLMLGALLSAGSNLLFAWLSHQGHDVTGLIAVVAADNLSGGIATAAFIAYLSALTNVRYSATQYALFSSIMLLAPKSLAGFSGRFVDAFGYANFFTATALIGLPVVVLVACATRFGPEVKVPPRGETS